MVSALDLPFFSWGRITIVTVDTPVLADSNGCLESHLEILLYCCFFWNLFGGGGTSNKDRAKQQSGASTHNRQNIGSQVQ